MQRSIALLLFVALAALGCESIAPLAAQMAEQYVNTLAAPPAAPPPPSYVEGQGPPPTDYTNQTGAPPPPPPPPPGSDYAPPPGEPPQTSAANSEEGCFEAVQGKVAWNRAGANRWNPSNVKKLCAGVTDTQARIACFSAEIQKHDKWSQAIGACTTGGGGGTSTSSGGNPEQSCFDSVQGKVAWNRAGANRWNPTNVKRLCAGVKSDSDSQRRIACFKGEIQKTDNWSRALGSCTAGGGGSASSSSSSSGNAEQSCYNAVQGKVAWNKAGAKSWNATNVKRLCKGVANDGDTRNRIRCFSGQIQTHNNWSTALASCTRSSGGSASSSSSSGGNSEQACFDAVQGKVAWNKAGAKGWNPTNVKKLCAGSTNSQATISCFKSQIQSHDNWSRAIDACKAKSTGFGSPPKTVFRSAGSYSVLGRSGEKTQFDCKAVTDEYEQLMFGDVLANPGNFVDTQGGSISRSQFDAGRQSGLRLSEARAGHGVGLLKTSQGARAKFLYTFAEVPGEAVQLELVDATVYSGDADGTSKRLGRIVLEPGSAVDLDPEEDSAATPEADTFDVGYRVTDEGQLVIESLGAAAVEFPTESLCGVADAAADGDSAS